MISIFNGRSRSLGETSKREVHLQLSVAFRRYLLHFKGAQLGVFMAIALHADEKGWAWPRVTMIRKETGYDDNTVHKALNRLCRVTIKGRRVLLRAKEAPAHYVAKEQDKNYVRNFYLLFPSAEEIAKHEASEEEGPNCIPKTVSKKRDSLFLDTKKVDTVFGTRSLNTKEEPSIKKNQKNEEDPPTPQAEPAASPSAPTLFPATPEKKAGGGVASRFSLKQCLTWAQHRVTQGAKIDAFAVASARQLDGTADELIEEFFARTPEQVAELRAAPEEQKLFYGEACDKIRSMLAIGRTPADVIREMPLDEGMRARLVEKFCPSFPIETEVD